MRLIFLLIVGGMLWSCNNNDPVVVEDTGTFATIQREIFEPSCVPCHDAGTSFAAQSNLVLTADVAYDQLVNRIPTNDAAREDGLELVGTKGLESLYTSYLWEKINVHDFEHFYTDHPDYGELMPLGGLPLTNGQLKMIQEWITEGAPEDGEVVDAKILEDETRFEFPEEAYTPLSPPASGIQLTLGPFEVAPNFERELFFFEELGNSETIFVNRVQVNMRRGSHHFILYDFPENDFPSPGVYRDIRNTSNQINFETVASILNQRFVFGTQWRSIDYTFPEGVALEVPANAGFDLNSHYVNRTSDPMQGEVSINLHTVEASEVSKPAKNLFLSNEDILLPAGKTTTLSRSWTFNERRHVFQLYSHAHEHMTEFKIYIVGGARDGELVYFANDWEHPPLLDLNPPIILEAGQGFRAETTYNNTTDKTLTFGLFSVDEMMIILGAYYTEQ